MAKEDKDAKSAKGGKDAKHDGKHDAKHDKDAKPAPAGKATEAKPAKGKDSAKPAKATEKEAAPTQPPRQSSIARPSPAR
jgi:hypothetical protein